MKTNNNIKALNHFRLLYFPINYSIFRIKFPAKQGYILMLDFQRRLKYQKDYAAKLQAEINEGYHNIKYYNQSKSFTDYVKNNIQIA